MEYGQYIQTTGSARLRKGRPRYWIEGDSGAGVDATAHNMLFASVLAIESDHIGEMGGQIDTHGHGNTLSVDIGSFYGRYRVTVDYLPPELANGRRGF